MSTLDKIKKLLSEGANATDDVEFIERLEKVSAQLQGIVNIKPADDAETSEVVEAPQSKSEKKTVAAGSAY